MEKITTKDIPRYVLTKRQFHKTIMEVIEVKRKTWNFYMRFDFADKLIGFENFCKVFEVKDKKGNIKDYYVKYWGIKITFNLPKGTGDNYLPDSFSPLMLIRENWR